MLGLVILRVKEPMLERPYKTWIITPLIFCAVRPPDCSPIYSHAAKPSAILGLFVPALHAHHRRAVGGDGRPR